MKILALDLGKNKSVSCVYEMAGGEHTFEQLPTTREAIGELLSKSQANRVVIEVGPSPV